MKVTFKAHEFFSYSWQHHFLRLKMFVVALSIQDKFLYYFFGLNYWSLTE